MLVTFVALFAASLWATTLAIEPEPVGAAEAPHPASHPGAVIQVYGADVWGFRGKFAIHTWVATKGENESDYTIHQVIGWRARRGRSVVAVSEGNPARPWFGSPAVLLHDERGPGTQVAGRTGSGSGRRLPFPPRIHDVARSEQQFLCCLDRPSGACAKPRPAGESDRSGLDEERLPGVCRASLASGL